MSESLKIQNGDLVVGSRSFQLVTAGDKLGQDLKLIILEKIGIDPSTPNYGSTLDGGNINGVEILPFIGRTISDQTVLEIQSEVVNVIQQYQAMQFSKMQAEMLAYNGLTTLAKNEVIETLNSVKALVIGTQILVQVVLTTLAGTTLQVTVPVQGL